MATAKAHSHRARLRPSTLVDGRRRARCEWGFIESTRKAVCRRQKVPDNLLHWRLLSLWRRVTEGPASLYCRLTSCLNWPQSLDRYASANPLKNDNNRDNSHKTIKMQIIRMHICMAPRHESELEAQRRIYVRTTCIQDRYVKDVEPEVKHDATFWSRVRRFPHESQQ